MSEFYIGNHPSDEPPPIYDLYGVINHHGGILGGHYTAYGRLPHPSDWRKNDVGKHCDIALLWLYKSVQFMFKTIYSLEHVLQLFIVLQIGACSMIVWYQKLMKNK